MRFSSIWRNFAWTVPNFTVIFQKYHHKDFLKLSYWIDLLTCSTRAILSIHFFSQNLMISDNFECRDSILTNNGSSKSDINIVNVSPISNFNNWSACPHSLVNWFVRIPYRDIAALNAVPGVTIWSSNTVVIDRTPNKIIHICGHINLKSLATWHFPFTVIQTVNFWITSDCERIAFIANLKNKKIIYLETGFVKCWTTHIEGSCGSGYCAQRELDWTVR